MSEHYIEITRDTVGLGRLGKYRSITDKDVKDYYAARLICTDPSTCPGWIECDKDHTGYDPDDETSVVFDEYEDVLIHGEYHNWRYGYGWVVDFPGCPVTGNDWEVPDEIDTKRDGKYLVDVEWEDEFVYLSVVKEVTDD